jgi:hypothetical protein
VVTYPHATVPQPDDHPTIPTASAKRQVCLAPCRWISFLCLWRPRSGRHSIKSRQVRALHESRTDADSLALFFLLRQLITCLLASYPLGSLFIRIPHTQPTLKHLFSISVASFYFVPVLNQGLAFLSLLGDVLFTYFVVRTVQGPRMPWIVFW